MATLTFTGRDRYTTLRGTTRIAVFTAWHRAYEYAREQAKFENLSIVSLEICS